MYIIHASLILQNQTCFGAVQVYYLIYIRQIKLKPKPANVRKAILFFFLLNILDGVESLGSRMTQYANMLY